MNLPTPDDLGRAPLWQNYVIAQAVQASAGQIPEHTLAFGVEVDGPRLRLRFQLSEIADADVEDMEDIVSELEGLVGNGVSVESVHELRSQREIVPFDDVCWIFLARTA